MERDRGLAGEYETLPSHGAKSLYPGRGATCGGARANLWLAPEVSNGDPIHPVSPRWRQDEGHVQLIEGYQMPVGDIWRYVSL